MNLFSEILISSLQCNWRLAWAYSACVWAKGRHFEQLLWQYSAIWQEMFQCL